ncbi:MAG: hypothetical protein C6W55_07470 [Thermobacillus sp.]|uniref:BclA C-terminal domain-containing protein n=1 Tax=Thermobacillus sp. TaxID=2108467 RepID=UPI000E3ACDDD|nr:collagen-like protein [Thermobacillus sp.]REK56578.1 MAG: hypothetical protein C6W55_07470 [Thermobacillus sp.]
MSAPNIPNITPVISIDRDDAINLLLSSIALEELGLSHILNAEGEKIQYMLGRLPGTSPPAPPTIDQMLAMNESVRQTLNTAMKNEMHLYSKLETVLGLLNADRAGTGTKSGQGTAGTNASAHPAWTATHAFAASTSNQTVEIDSAGTAIRFPDNQVLSGVMKNAANTVFTVPATGHYLVTWMVNIGLAASDFIALTINNVIYAPAMLTSSDNTGYTSTVIVPLASGSNLSVKIFGPGRTTSLFDGAGATLTIVRVK